MPDEEAGTTVSGCGLSGDQMTASQSIANGMPRGEASGDTQAAVDRVERSRTDDADLPSKIREINAGFGEIVALLARDPRHRHMSLGDLEWAVMPPLRAGQFLTVRGKIKDRDDLSVPLAVALWAKVSPEVNDKLDAQKAAGARFRLAPHEWTSGEIPWLMLSVAPNELADRLVAKLGDMLGVELKTFG
ncbi:toxin-activating lysine-acyltransferase [Stappia sp. MMSF_3263]|uniref:toxin-activating lysine-acyltransferase n=1 Tax=Stappia sp. MMSF_3263 TaxID=3046693 RepID=UPI00273FE3AF|nr:toxin-activating lysine-acyltransferase [Stappia sp. MMSF_3263]